MNDFFSEFAPSAWQQDGCLVVVQRATTGVARNAVRAGNRIVASVLVVGALAVAATPPSYVVPTSSASAGAARSLGSDEATGEFWGRVSSLISRLGPRSRSENGFVDPELPDTDR